ncbi:MAG: protoporphyrinogen/coproporphyrinogen oxidase [Polyangiales bacterium]
MALEHDQSSWDVAIVGGGIAGLAVALHLLERRPSARVIVLERRRSVGGNVRTLVRDGCTIDLGPDAIVDRPPDASALASGLGLSLGGPGARSVSVVRHGELLPLPEGLAFGVPRDLRAIAGTRLLSMLGKLRAGCDLVIPRTDVAGLGVGAIVEKRLGREVKEALVEPLLSGVYGGDVDRLDPALVMPNLTSGTSVLRGLARAPRPKGSPFVGPLGGMQALTDAMHAQLEGRARVRCGAEVTAIAEARGGTKISLGNESFVAKRTVLASPPPAAARLVHELDPELSERLDSFAMRTSVSVILAYPRAECVFPEGSGILVARGEAACFVAATFVHAKWPERVSQELAVVRAVVTAERSPELMGLDDDAIAARVHEDLQRFAQVPAPRWSHVEHFDRATAIPEVGHAARVAEARSLAEAHGITLAGAAFDGPGIAGSVRGGKAIAALLS